MSFQECFFHVRPISLLFSFLLPELSVELLLVRLHVDATLQLGAGCADLKPHGAVGDTLVELLETGHTAILHGVLETRSKVRDELVDGSVKSQHVMSKWSQERGRAYPLCATAPETPWATRTLSPSEKYRAVPALLFWLSLP